MKLWTLELGIDLGTQVLGIYSSEEKANKAADAYRVKRTSNCGNPNWSPSLEINEFELDGQV